MENLEEALEDAYIDGIAKGFPEGQAAERKATVSYLKKMNLPDIAEKIEQGAHWTKTEYYGYLLLVRTEISLCISNPTPLSPINLKPLL